jgi:hypothetical protein
MTKLEGERSRLASLCKVMVYGGRVVGSTRETFGVAEA